MEHRWGQRAPARVDVRLILPCAVGRGILRDISMSGAFIETNLHATLLSRVQVEIQLTSARYARKWAPHGFVTRNDEYGMGIEWNDLSPAAVSELLGALSETGTMDSVAGDTLKLGNASMP